MKKPTLFLFPNLLDESGDHRLFLPPAVDQAVARIDGLIAESEKGGRRFLKRFTFPHPKTFRDIPIRLLNEHSHEGQITDLLKPMLAGECWGLVSDCGMPCLADPGSQLVFHARQQGIHLETFSGPSSILFALVLSGLNGQHFTFHGYLPKEGPLLIKKIQQMEQRSSQEGSTHLFIEAPYRNQKLLELLLKILHGKTQLGLAIELTNMRQEVFVKTVEQWKTAPLPQIDRRPTVFLLRQ
jgi:16S rRNA (cytidine1402-2'-O)-methyltransferase